MTIKIIHQLSVYRGYAYMKLEEWLPRKDIQLYLKDPNCLPKDLHYNVDQYLISKGLIKEGTLTELGKTVQETGLFPQNEEGKYLIWYTDNDTLVRTVILNYKRATISFDHQSRTEREQKNFDILLVRSDSPDCTLKETRLSVEPWRQNSDQQPITLHIELDEQKETYISFKGKLSGTPKEELNLHSSSRQKISYSWENLLSDIGIRLGGDWNSTDKRLAISYDSQLNIETLRKFLITKTISLENGDVAEIHYMEVVPRSKYDALQWFNHLIRYEASKNYLQTSDIADIASIREHPSLVQFAEVLPTPSIQELLQKTNSDQREIYWHLHAPNDLNPQSYIKTILEPITLLQGSQISFAELVRKLGIEKAKQVCYVDRYIQKSYQQNTIGILLRTLDAKENVILTSKKEDMDKTRNNKTYLEEFYSKVNITIKEQNKELPRSPHDRYLLVLDTEGQLSAWNITGGLTCFILKDVSNITKDTPLEVRDDTTITPRSLSTISQNLVTYIKETLKWKI